MFEVMYSWIGLPSIPPGTTLDGAALPNNGSIQLLTDDWIPATDGLNGTDPAGLLPRWEGEKDIRPGFDCFSSLLVPANRAGYDQAQTRIDPLGETPGALPAQDLQRLARRLSNGIGGVEDMGSGGSK